MTVRPGEMFFLISSPVRRDGWDLREVERENREKEKSYIHYWNSLPYLKGITSDGPGPHVLLLGF